MNAAIICFTAEGLATARRIREVLVEGEPGSRRSQETAQFFASDHASQSSAQQSAADYTTQRSEQPSAADDGVAEGYLGVSLYMKKKDASDESGVTMVQGSVRSWAGEVFPTVDALIFVGAAGIAVRSIAPYIVSKTKDPAVVVVDERGTFAISLLSGHLGGANELADRIAAGIGAVSVITTATDRNHLFAVDVFARENSLAIDDMKIAKEISAALLDRKPVGFSSDFPLRGDVPHELTPAQTPIGIAVCRRLDECPFERTLHLIPRAYVLGVGCRKDKDSREMEEFLLRFLRENGVPLGSVVKIASIDLKKEEKAILEFSGKYSVPAVFYSAEELKDAPGEFTASEFVKSHVGVDNVCARAAVLGASDGSCLVVPKTAENGMTAALAIGKVELSFS